MKIFERQSICIYLSFAQSNMDFQESNFGLPFTRVNFQKKNWSLVDLYADVSIARKLYIKTSEIIMSYNEIK